MVEHGLRTIAMSERGRVASLTRFALREVSAGDGMALLD
jgi:hypothetical protein